MNGSELASALADRMNITKTLAREMVDAMFDPDSGIIANDLAAGNAVSYQGFGAFKLVTRAARKGNGPHGAWETDEKTAVKFVVGKNLKERISG